jgi:ATP-dependent Clp protease protease subunit
MMLDSREGTLEAALTVIDVIDLLGVPVHVTCVGSAEGAAIGVLAVAARRLAAPHARFRLCEPATSFEGRARDVARWAEYRERQVRQFCERIAAAAGQPVARITAAMAEGRFLDVDAARRFGLVDEIARPTAASVHSIQGREIGFRPLR